MHFLGVCLCLSLALLAVNSSAIEKLSDKDLSLKVIRPDGEKFLTLRCSMIPYRTYLAKVTKVEIFAADDLDGETGKFKRLAVLKKGWCKPRLATRVTEEDAHATGEILDATDEQTFLEFTWKKETGGYCRSYECVATGIDKDGNPTTIFTLNRVKSKENKACTTAANGCVC